jgi:hypothetical protein
MQSTKRVNISISPENHLGLKKCGFAGDSFNDVISELLRDRTKNKVAAVGSGLEAQDQLATSTKGAVETHDG